MYSNIQNKVDILIANNFVGINDWKDDEAKAYIHANTRVPTGTFQPGTALYVLIGYTRVAEEQGI